MKCIKLYVKKICTYFYLKTLYHVVKYWDKDNTSMEKLTKREEEVLRYVITGKNNVEIAKLLFISSHTVKAHVSAILTKFGVKTRVEAVVHAIKNGLYEKGISFKD